MFLKFLLFSIFVIPQFLFSQIVEEKIQIDTNFITYKVIYKDTLVKGVFSKRVAVFANDTSTIAIEKNYTYTSQNGFYKVYYPTGKLMLSTIYGYNMKNGDWSYYNENGTLLIKGIYKDDIKHGYWAYRFLKCYGRYKKGKKVGNWKCRNTDGGKYITKYPSMYFSGITDLFKTNKNNTKEVNLPIEKQPINNDFPQNQDSITEAKIDTFYLSAITYLARNYYIRNRIKIQFTEKKKERKAYDKYFDYSKDLFLFDIAPITVPTGLAPFLTEKEPLKSSKIDSLLNSNPEKYKQAFSETEFKPNNSLQSYSTKPSSTMILYFSEVIDNMVRVDIVEYLPTNAGLEKNYEEIYRNPSARKYAILIHFNNLKDVESVEYQQQKVN